MAQDSKYGQVDIPGIPDDEPVFILRGKDLATPDAVRGYADFANDEGSSAEFCNSVLVRADEIQNWQDEHTDLTKAAD